MTSLSAIFFHVVFRPLGTRATSSDGEVQVKGLVKVMTTVQLRTWVEGKSIFGESDTKVFLLGHSRPLFSLISMVKKHFWSI